jgi:hypothetical protein
MKGIAMSSKSSLLGIGSAVAVIMLAAAVIGSTASPVAAKPEFATQTGKACGACHTNPSGGGKLTGAGEKFKQTKK